MLAICKDFRNFAIPIRKNLVKIKDNGKHS